MEQEKKGLSFNFESLLLILSIYVIVELYLESVMDFSDETMLYLEWIDFGICMLFLYDFITGIWRAEDKWKYFKLHWIDLISSIPTVGFLRIGRIFRVIRILRVLRSARYILSFFSKKNSFNTFKNLFLVSILIIALFTLSFYHAERSANPFIDDMGDSLWWTTVTTITVGFLQDIPPVTVEGKFLSIALILLGMIIFSTLTGTITDYFIEDEDIQESIKELAHKVETLEEKLDQINSKLDNLNNS